MAKTLAPSKTTKKKVSITVRRSNSSNNGSSSGIRSTGNKRVTSSKKLPPLTRKKQIQGVLKKKSPNHPRGQMKRKVPGTQRAASSSFQKGSSPSYPLRRTRDNGNSRNSPRGQMKRKVPGTRAVAASSSFQKDSSPSYPQRRTRDNGNNRNNRKVLFPQGFSADFQPDFGGNGGNYGSPLGSQIAQIPAILVNTENQSTLTLLLRHESGSNPQEDNNNRRVSIPEFRVPDFPVSPNRPAAVSDNYYAPRPSNYPVYNSPANSPSNRPASTAISHQCTARKESSPSYSSYNKKRDSKKRD